MACFIAAGTSYATWATPMIPFYLFYSMFGFQRIGDLIWALGDMRGRGFLLGCTAGRTTLNGEGLQHEDGHCLLLASTVPNVTAYDPAFAYEVADHRRGRDPADVRGPEPEDRFYYLTLYNENYAMPALPDGADGASDPTGDDQGHVPVRRAAPERTAGRARPRSCSRAPPGRPPSRPSGSCRRTGTSRPSCGR